MVFSNDETFEVKFIDPFRLVKGQPLEYKHIATPQGICIIGEPDKHFQIQVSCTDRNVYGVRLIVDGFTLSKRKTFKSKTILTGFPQEGGDFKCFKFQRPPSDPDSSNQFKGTQYRPPWDEHQNDIRDYKGGPGEIIIKLFNTEQVPAKSGGGGGGSSQQVEPRFRHCTINEKKNQYDQSLGVCEGDVIVSAPRGGGGGGNPKEFTDKVLYEEIVQSFRLIYSDSASLIQKGYINLSNHADLTYLTEEYLTGNHTAMVQILQTIIWSGQKDQLFSYVQQTLDVIVERLDYYLQSFDCLNLFMSAEEQSQQFQLDRTQLLQAEIEKFINSFPEFFTIKAEKVYGIAALYTLDQYLKRKTASIETEPDVAVTAVNPKPIETIEIMDDEEIPLQSTIESECNQVITEVIDRQIPIQITDMPVTEVTIQ